jgi:hypothetical protein
MFGLLPSVLWHVLASSYLQGWCWQITFLWTHCYSNNCRILSTAREIVCMHRLLGDSAIHQAFPLTQSLAMGLPLLLQLEAAVAAASPEARSELQRTLDGLKAATARLEAVQQVVRTEDAAGDKKERELRRASL